MPKHHWGNDFVETIEGPRIVNARMDNIAIRYPRDRHEARRW
jgi:hypothetical protein